MKNYLLIIYLIFTDFLHVLLKSDCHEQSCSLTRFYEEIPGVLKT